MFKHLLVPLDGSALAETALPAAVYLAQTLKASVTLIHVIERHAPLTIHGERHLTGVKEARAYLDEVAGRTFPHDWPVERHVHSSEVGDVARSLVAHVGELSPDLIVMCTHGHGGLRHRLFGSMAQQVIALGTTPLLLIRPPLNGTPHPFACRQVLAPLDGKPDHEQGLALAASLAQACEAVLHLVMVVPTLHTLAGERAATATLLPGATSALLDMTVLDAGEYLSHHATRLRAAGLSVLAEVYRGDPVTTIIHTARRVEADLIVLGTHGKAGMEAFWSGSVASKIAGRSSIPLLLVPVEN
jgi:nucleotide-binding universal stress UspA family protein